MAKHKNYEDSHFEEYLETQKIVNIDIEKRMKEAVRTEWMRIISPEYDCRWFTGGEKVEQWKEEMKSIVEKL